MKICIWVMFACWVGAMCVVPPSGTLVFTIAVYYSILYPILAGNGKFYIPKPSSRVNGNCHSGSRVYSRPIRSNSCAWGNRVTVGHINIYCPCSIINKPRLIGTRDNYRIGGVILICVGYIPVFIKITTPVNVWIHRAQGVVVLEGQPQSVW